MCGTRCSPVTWWCSSPPTGSATANRLGTRSLRFGIVDHKVSQADVWTTRSLEVYRGYRNLLIRATDGGFEHHEPGTLRKQWHRDWLWRIVDTDGFRKPEIVTASSRGHFELGLRIGHRPLRVASNYILFRSAPSPMVLAQPPVVAEASASGSSERWRVETFARELHSLLFKPGVRPCLRTGNRQMVGPRPSRRAPCAGSEEGRGHRGRRSHVLRRR